MDKKKTERIKQTMAFITLTSIPVIFMGALFFVGDDEQGPGNPEQEGAQGIGIQEDRVPMEDAQEVEDPEPLDIPTDKDLEAGQGLAQDFIEAFHEFDAKDPVGYLAKSLPYMTDSMAGHYKGIPKRGAGGVIREHVVEMEVLPSYLENGNQVWRIGATGEAEREDGKDFTFTEYEVLMVKQGNDWKVDGVKVNGY